MIWRDFYTVLKEKCFYPFFFAASFCFLGLYWLAYFPGCMSPDSEAQWWEAHHLDQLSDSHPALYTLFISFLSKIWDSPAVLILFNLVLFSVLLSAILSYFYRKGVRFIVLFAFLAIVTLIPTNGRMMVTFWKDITYSIGMFYFFFIFVKLVLDKNIYYSRSFFIAEFIIAALLILNSRHNGIFVVAGCTFFLFFLLRKSPKILLKVSLSVFILIFGNHIMVTNVLKAKKGWYTLEHTMVRHLGTYLVNNKLSGNEKNVLLKIMPEISWVKHYSPWTHDGFAFGPDGEKYRNLVPKYKTEIRQLFFKKIKEDPATFFISEKEITQLLWRPVGKEGSYLNTYCTTCGHGVSEHLRFFLDNATAFSDQIQTPFYTRYLFWSGALYILLCFCFVLMLFISNKKDDVLVFLPDILNNLSLAIAITAQDYRYIYSSFLIFPFVLLFLFYKLAIVKKFFRNHN